MSDLLPTPPVPLALRKKGLHGCADNLPAGKAVHVPGSVIVAFFGDELLKRFTQPAVPATGAAKGDGR